MEDNQHSYPSLPSNYTTILDLQKRWIDQKQHQQPHKIEPLKDEIKTTNPISQFHNPKEKEKDDKKIRKKKYYKKKKMDMKDDDDNDQQKGRVIGHDQRRFNVKSNFKANCDDPRSTAVINGPKTRNLGHAKGPVREPTQLHGRTNTNIDNQVIVEDQTDEIKGQKTRNFDHRKGPVREPTQLHGVANANTSVDNDNQVVLEDQTAEIESKLKEVSLTVNVNVNVNVSGNNGKSRAVINDPKRVYPCYTRVEHRGSFNNNQSRNVRNVHGGYGRLVNRGLSNHQSRHGVGVGVGPRTGNGRYTNNKVWVKRTQINHDDKQCVD